jgi:hypothetical protein
MSDISESAFNDAVEEWIDDHFPTARVEDNPTLSDTDRQPDYWLYLAGMNVAIEVENDWEACVKGVGQALMYAAHLPNTVPVVLLPTGYAEQPESEMVASRTPVIICEVDYDEHE